MRAGCGSGALTWIVAVFNLTIQQCWRHATTCKPNQKGEHAICGAVCTEWGAGRSSVCFGTVLRPVLFYVQREIKVRKKKRGKERGERRTGERLFGGSGPRVLRRDKEKVKEREMGWGEKERGHGVTRTSYRFISSENGERLVGKQTENNMSANSYRSQKHVKTSDYLSPTKPKAVLLAGAEP